MPSAADDDKTTDARVDRLSAAASRASVAVVEQATI
jgi:hypothetical protein